MNFASSVAEEKQALQAMQIATTNAINLSQWFA
jgi:hypothetical protein